VDSFDIPLLVASSNLLSMYSDTIPLLSTTSAHLLAGLFAFTYVGSIYASKSARLRLSKRKVNLPEGQARLKLQTERWRDDPNVIKARLLAVGSATLICCLIVFIVMKNGNGDNTNVGYLLWWRTMHELCVTNPEPYRKCVAPPWIHVVAYISPPSNTVTIRWTTLCPISRKDATVPRRLGFRTSRPVSILLDLWSSELFRCKCEVSGVWWKVLSLHFQQAPITEEVVFRACVLTVYHLAGASRKKMIFLSPLVFGAGM